MTTFFMGWNYMDLSLLPSDFKYASNNQLAFIKKSSIAEICKRFQTYERSKNNPSMKHVIKQYQKILDHLHEEGYVSKISNPSSKWVLYTPNEESVVNMYREAIKEKVQQQKQNVEETPKPSITQPTVCDKSEPITFDLSDHDLSGIDLICAIADKYRNLAFSARKRGIEFDLSIDDVQDIVLAKRCYYTNVEFDGDKNIKTVDRLNHKKGYVKDNIVACTKRINSFKNEILESNQTKLFSNVEELKRFVDILYVSQLDSVTPLDDLLNQEILNTMKKGL